MFHDYDALVARLLKADPEWQFEAVQEIKMTLVDHDDWCRSGRPPRHLWPIYKMLRDPESYRSTNRSFLLEKITEAGIVDPCPISWHEWALSNPIEAERAEQSNREVEEYLATVCETAVEQANDRRAEVRARQKQLRQSHPACQSAPI